MLENEYGSSEELTITFMAFQRRTLKKKNGGSERTKKNIEINQMNLK